MTAAPAVLVASAATFDGDDKDGGVVSSIVTVKAFVLVLPEASVATMVTIVTPSGKMLPDAGFAAMAGAGSKSSVALGLAKVTIAPAGDVASAMTLVTSPMAGGVASVALISTISGTASSWFALSRPTVATRPK